MRYLLVPALFLALAGTAPAHAFGTVPEAPSLWPAKDAFDKKVPAVTRNAVADLPTPPRPEADR